MTRDRVFVGLGSNVGDRRGHLRRAVKGLAALPTTRVKALSRVYETAPVGPRQRNFFNAVAELRSNLSPDRLLEELKALERALGRRKRRRWGPREIDLDLILYGARRRRTTTLHLPHPRWRERRFVLVPLMDIAPRFRDPLTGQSVTVLARKLTDPDQWIRLSKRPLV